VAARMWMLLDDEFNHFDATVWYQPYYDVLESEWLLAWMLLQWGENDKVSLYDLLSVYVWIMHTIDGDNYSPLLNNVIPVSYKQKLVTRESFAVITELFTKHIYSTE
jgi:hypothetical protein